MFEGYVNHKILMICGWYWKNNNKINTRILIFIKQ